MLRSALCSAGIQLRNTLLCADTTLVQQTRNTFILKRKWPTGLHKKNGRQRSLRSRNFVYELVEDTTVKKKPNLEVVLTSFVDGIGKKGDVVSLKESVAYNKLLLPGLAVYKTPENIAKYANLKTETVEEVKHSSPHAQRTVNMLQSIVLAVIMNKDHPWQIEPWHIRMSLRRVGFYAPEEAIELPKQQISGPDLTKENKEFFVTITINNLEKAIVRCRIHHWSTDPSDRLPYIYQHWNEPAEPLFGIESIPPQIKDKI